jgi:hypothetical protein
MGNSGQMVHDPPAIPRARLHDHFHPQLTCRGVAQIEDYVRVAQLPSPTATPDDPLQAHLV